MALIEFSDKGLYCPAGDFYIDPWKPVNYAVISHGHSDHARWGSTKYLCHTHTKPILEARLGPGHYQTANWAETVFINGVKVSLHPAGHIIGSAQIRVEWRGEVWVFSGDYKTENDGISTAFEPVKCHTFITECTFGLPIYHWKPQAHIYNNIENWIKTNQQEGKTSVLFAYSLGKAQRILAPVSKVTNTILVHGAVYNVHAALAAAGWELPAVQRVTPDTPKELLKGGVVIAPSSAEGSTWMRKFAPYSVGVCSGWMQVRGAVRRRNVDAGFVLSDHADWAGLLSAVKATGAERVYATHGFQASFSRYLTELGLDAREVKTEYGNDEEAPPELAEGTEETITEETG